MAKNERNVGSAHEGTFGRKHVTLARVTGGLIEGEGADDINSFGSSNAISLTTNS